MPDNPCQTCGACCVMSSEWPVFTTDSDHDIALIPAAYVNDQGTGMHCEGNRCSALVGIVGRLTACSVYGVRPDTCRACQPGDPECVMARERHGLPALSLVSSTANSSSAI